MSKLFKSRIGWKILKVDLVEMIYNIGGLGICDSCNADIQDSSEEANLILVLNQIYCDNCYKEFDARGKYYSEDVWFEDKQLKFYKEFMVIDK